MEKRRYAGIWGDPDASRDYLMRELGNLAAKWGKLLDFHPGVPEARPVTDILTGVRAALLAGDRDALTEMAKVSRATRTRRNEEVVSPKTARADELRHLRDGMQGWLHSRNAERLAENFRVVVELSRYHALRAELSEMGVPAQLTEHHIDGLRKAFARQLAEDQFAEREPDPEAYVRVGFRVLVGRRRASRVRNLYVFESKRAERQGSI